MALIDNNTELKRHNSSITGQLNIASIQSFLDDADNKYLIPSIGRAQFDDIVTSKPTIVAGSSKETLLLALQKAAVNFAIAEYSDFGAVQITNSGIGVVKTDNVLPASDKKLMKLRQQSERAGFAALELAVDFAEEHLSDFPLYAASDEHLANRSLFINSSREFPQKLPVAPDLFAGLKAIIAKVEDEYLLPLLGEDLFADIKEKILAKSLQEIDRELLRKIRIAVGSLAIAEGIPYRLVSFDGTGTYVKSETVGGISGNVENRNPAEIERLQYTMNKLVKDGCEDLERLRKWLNTHAVNYPTYTKSTSDVLNQVNDDPSSPVYFL